MFIVIEIQKDVTAATLVSTHDTRNEAENKYHTVLAYAAVSSLPKHSAVLMDENGITLKQESYFHEVEEPEEEPNE